jgi:hypothetical protein
MMRVDINVHEVRLNHKYDRLNEPNGFQLHLHTGNGGHVYATMSDRTIEELIRQIGLRMDDPIIRKAVEAYI